jgi:FtsP/CotA-like multicopper oxidase with cupredoxin domain
MAIAATPTGINPAVDITLPNYANSPNIRKFVDSLAGLGVNHKNNLGQYIPLAVPDINSYPGSDYYEIGLKDHPEQMNSDLPPTKIRGYYQINTTDPNVAAPHYLGPLIIAQRDRAVRFKFFNQLSTGPLGNLSLPVDTTVMGAGMGPLGGTEMYTQNRATIHLHGGLTPWISDGTPHQWVTPAFDPTSYKKGVSFQNVPDMVNGSGIPCIGGATCFTPSLNDGTGTYYYPNQQSARLMFYHDHAYGITRLNVYAGEAAGYLLVDQAEKDLIEGNVSAANPTGAKILPDLGIPEYKYGIPLIIQDKTFVNDATTPLHANFAATGAIPTPKTAAVDPLWYTYVPGSIGGSLWLPHEYLPNENIYDPTGFNVMGRWDYAPWMIPPMLALNNTLPSPTIVPEAFMDTPVVNGTAFPYLELPPTAVRFRILNACNDRMLNLQLYKAEPLTVVVTTGGAGYSAPVVTFSAPPTGVTATGTATMANGIITGITVTNPGSGYTSAPLVTITGGAGTGATAYATVGTEVSMVPAIPNPAYPTWPVDGRAGGVPDPVTAGPTMIQIGNEAGFLAKVAVIPPHPVDFDYSRRSVTFGGVTSKALYMPPAVRADIIVDFSSYKDGDTLILYNDAPAPMPLYDTRYDYFTGAPDLTAIGGAPSTTAGFGPNTRTIMQIRIKGTATAPFNLAALQTALPKAFAASQDAPLVPAAAYNAAYGTKYQDIYANSVAETLNVTGTPQPVVKVMTELPGLGYTTPPTVSFYGGFPAGCVAPACTPARATATLNGVTGVTLVTSGSGCSAPPAVTLTPPGATATAIISGGVVTTVAITNPGSNYLVAPTVTFNGGCTTLPTATANVTLGSVGAINLTNPGSGYISAPRIYLTGGGGTGAMAAAMLNGALVMNGKNLVEGFDMEFGRMNAVLGSTPNPLAPTVGAGPIIGANFYVDPPTEILKTGETVLWRLNHLGVDSHAIHFHLFNVQVVNRVDWTNTIKPPYDDELGWKETIRTNPFEDIIVAIRPVAMNLPFALPDSNRLLDVTSPAGSTAMFLPVAPPPGIPAVAQTTNVMTNFGWEYVWHCHLLGHEENDMMRPIVFLPGAPVANAAPTTLVFGNQVVNTTSLAKTVTLTNKGAAGTQSLIIKSIGLTGTNAADFAQANNCGPGLAPGASCAINVTFSPSLINARSATLAIASNDPVNATLNVPLGGTGTVLPLPAPWQTRDIGTVGVVGGASYLNNVFSVFGAGFDIWGTTDAFRYVYQPMTGDGQIVAHVASIQNTNTAAKAGVMMRETLTNNSIYAMMVLSPAKAANFQRRLTTGGTHTATAGAMVTAPYWVKLVRSGSTISGFISADGTTWIQVGSDTITMASTIYVGLPVTSHDSTRLCTATFDGINVTTGGATLPTASITAPANGAAFVAPASIPIAATATAGSGATINKVEFFNGTTLLGTATTSPYSYTWSNVAAGSYSLTSKTTNSQGLTATSAPVAITVGSTLPGLPTPWVFRDIASTGVPGSATYANGVFTVKGAGWDIWGTADSFGYTYQPWTGNGQIVARVASLQNTDPSAKGGVMMRETLTSGSTYAMMGLSPGKAANFQRRLTTGASYVPTAGPMVTAPYWVKLVRSGNIFSGYISPDGVTWTLVGSDTIPMANTIYVGLPVTSHNAAVLCTATFDGVVVQ